MGVWYAAIHLSGFVGQERDYPPLGLVPRGCPVKPTSQKYGLTKTLRFQIPEIAPVFTSRPYRRQDDTSLPYYLLSLGTFLS
jgi:hypothetical protein